MKRRYWLLTAALVMLAVGVQARPGRGRRGPNRGPGAMLMRCIRISGLKLSPIQIEKLQNLRDQLRIEFAKVRPKLRELRKESFQVLTNPALSNEQVFARLKETRQKRQEILDPIRKKGLQIRQILTKEQLEKLRNTPQCLQPGWMGPGQGMAPGQGMGPRRFRGRPAM